MTFINKLDRETPTPFDLLDEIEKTLALDVAPITWPLGSGRSFIAPMILNAMSCAASTATPRQAPSAVQTIRSSKG